MRTFTIQTEPYGTFASADGVVYAEKDNADRHGERLRALVDQANAGNALLDALKRAMAYERDCLPVDSWEDIEDAADAAIKACEVFK
jgi:hypothetical protein